MNRFRNLLSFPGIFLRTFNALRIQRKFIKTSLDPLLKKFREGQNPGLTNSDIKKIKHYYGYAVPAILGEGFCILRGEPMTYNERMALTCLGALTGLYDDFFDKLDTSASHILELTTDPNENNAHNIHELVFVKFYKIALDHCPDSKLIKQRFIEVYEAQLLSKRQKNNHLSQGEIRSITFAKGGASLLFYRNALPGQMDENERNLLYTLGGLMQLENDIFDIHKDHQDNVDTLATATKNIAELRKEYFKLYREILNLLHQTHFAQNNKLTFLRFINLIIFRGLVCLDCLERNEANTNGIFVIEHYERKQLICDMEKIKNLFKLFQYYVRSQGSLVK